MAILEAAVQKAIATMHLVAKQILIAIIRLHCLGKWQKKHLEESYVSNQITFIGESITHHAATFFCRSVSLKITAFVISTAVAL